MRVITDYLHPVKVWADEVEPGAMEQISHLASLPFVAKQVAIMPDVHQGYGMPIGGVLATEGVILPNAVGVDEGCGMRACRTSIRADELGQDVLKRILGRIREVVPVGFTHHKTDQPCTFAARGPVGEREAQAALRQVGTLGGGNHFIEIQRGSDGFVWIMIHSGSRNVGKQVADFYNREAVRLNARWHAVVPAAWELAFLPLDEGIGQIYYSEMTSCLEFARENRTLMMTRIQEAVAAEVPAAVFRPDLDVHHNYAQMENHFGRNVMVHRKGATRARDGEVGIIPGSQGTASYIVEGLGNPESFQSCSHGAGRRMGRKEAQRKLNLKEEQKRLDEQGILHAIRGKGDLDEAAGAYKDIDAVMAQQTDLVKVVVKLTPMAVVKG